MYAQTPERAGVHSCVRKCVFAWVGGVSITPSFFLFSSMLLSFLLSPSLSLAFSLAFSLAARSRSLSFVLSLSVYLFDSCFHHMTPSV